MLQRGMFVRSVGAQFTEMSVTDRKTRSNRKMNSSREDFPDEYSDHSSAYSDAFSDDVQPQREHTVNMSDMLDRFDHINVALLLSKIPGK